MRESFTSSAMACDKRAFQFRCNGNIQHHRDNRNAQVVKSLVRSHRFLNVLYIHDMEKSVMGGNAWHVDSCTNVPHAATASPPAGKNILPAQHRLVQSLVVLSDI